MTSLSNRSIGVSITVPLDLLEKVDTICADKRISRSGFIRDAIEAATIREASSVRSNDPMSGMPGA